MNNQLEQNPNSRIPSLDGLRGIAILFVLMAHGYRSLHALPGSWVTFIGNGTLGVNIFFVLSGFLIYNLSAREVEKSGMFNWRLFYVRRVLRIFPCFYFFILVLLSLKYLGLIQLSWPVILSASTFNLNYRHVWDQTPMPADYFVIGHYWTLALEEQFYLTWPLLMLLFVRRRLLTVLSVIMVLAPLVRVVCYFLTPGSRGQIGMMFHTGFDSIAAGVLLGELRRRPGPRAWLQRIAANPWIVGLSVVFLVFVSPLLTERFRGAYEITIGKTLELACLGTVITAAVSCPGTRMFRFLNWGPLVYIGVLSYSLYVWNNLFLYSGWQGLIGAFPVNFLCLFAMAATSYHLVEKPFLKLKACFHRSEERQSPTIDPAGTASLVRALSRNIR